MTVSRTISTGRATSIYFIISLLQVIERLLMKQHNFGKGPVGLKTSARVCVFAACTLHSAQAAFAYIGSLVEIAAASEHLEFGIWKTGCCMLSHPHLLLYKIVTLADHVYSVHMIS